MSSPGAPSGGFLAALEAISSIYDRFAGSLERFHAGLEKKVPVEIFEEFVQSDREFLKRAEELSERLETARREHSASQGKEMTTSTVARELGFTEQLGAAVSAVKRVSHLRTRVLKSLEKEKAEISGEMDKIEGARRLWRRYNPFVGRGKFVDGSG